MCGLVGFLAANSTLDMARVRAIVASMMTRLNHRGPDDSGTWCDPDTRIALGFRRLSIIDLSDAARQPMTSRSGRYVVVFNGEIYNHLELKKKLEESALVEWKGHSDTEVLVEAIDRYGFAKALRQFDGMFAIAAWDIKLRQLFLGRDRFGEKPLYYGNQKGTFLFGSELKALTEHPDWDGIEDQTGTALFLRYGYVPTPYTAYLGINKLMPGSWLTVDAFGNYGTPKSYWSIAEQAALASNRPFKGDFNDALIVLDELLSKSVLNRRFSDVPLGTFLSGGVDSSLISAILQSQSRKPIQSFCMGFPGTKFDESIQANKIASHLGTSHSELRVKSGDLLSIIPKLGHVYDEPFADASQIPTIFLCAEVSKYLKVTLSGDGGDELFGGYPRYIAAARSWSQNHNLPKTLNYLAQNSLTFLAGKPGALARRARKKLRRIAANSPKDIYQNYVSWWPLGELTSDTDPDTRSNFASENPNLQKVMPIEAQFSVLDALTYLPDNLEVKMDRASMASGLEVRAPFLDYRIAEFAWSLPADWKFNNDSGKKILRTLLSKYLPKTLTRQPKQGFEPPISEWLRSHLREWAEDLLSVPSLDYGGLLAPKIVSERWHEHVVGRRNWAYPLWTILMLQTWRREHLRK